MKAYTKEEFKAMVSMAYEGRDQWEEFLERVWQLHINNKRPKRGRSEIPNNLSEKPTSSRKPKWTALRRRMYYERFVELRTTEPAISTNKLYIQVAAEYGVTVQTVITAVKESKAMLQEYHDELDRQRVDTELSNKPY